MTWEQKLEALKALAPTEVRMRKPGDWYATNNAEIGGNGFLRGVPGNGTCPQTAVEALWFELTELAFGQYLVVHAGPGDRSHWKWNGYRWEQLTIQRRDPA